MTVEPLVTHIYFQGSVYLESHAAPEHAAYAASSQSSHLPTLPPNHRVRFSGRPVNLCACCTRLAWVMAINAARNQDCSGKGLAEDGGPCKFEGCAQKGLGDQHAYPAATVSNLPLRT